VEGTFRVGPVPAPKVEIELLVSAMQAYGPEGPRISAWNYATTADDGRFGFDRVFSGEAGIGRNITYMVNEGATEVTSSQRIRINCEAGKTTQVDLGGTGRPVIGKIVPMKGSTEKVLWNFARVRVQLELPQVTPTSTKEEIAAYNALQAVAPFINATVDRDGSFRVDDLPSGKYTLDVHFDQRSAGHISEYKFTVPPIEGTYMAEPLDLSTLQLAK
jgi:hypothetical protein